MTIILFIVVLLITVLVHEWGHFYAARKCGMIVEEFGFGIPPRLWSFKKGETVYSINALPIGGFVRIAGENGLEGNVAPNRQFDTKPWWKKSIVLVAGVVCNILLAIVLFTGAYMIGMPTIGEGGVPTVVTVVANSPAHEAGIVAGDTISAVSIDNVSVTPLTTEALHTAVTNSRGNVSISYDHKGTTHTAMLMAKDTPEGKMIGLGIQPIKDVRLPFFQALASAFFQVLSLIAGIWATLAGLVAGLFAGTGSTAGLTGPVGLVHEVGNAATIGFAYLVAFTAAISVNLAVLNIMPFPALDGGRLIVVLLEALVGRRFSQKVVGIIHASGFLLLLILMLFLTIGDVRRLL